MNESPKKLKVSRTDAGDLVVSYGGTPIENVSALSISVSPMGAMATLVFTIEEVDVETALHRVIGCKEEEEKFSEMEIN